MNPSPLLRALVGLLILGYVLGMVYLMLRLPHWLAAL